MARSTFTRTVLVFLVLVLSHLLLSGWSLLVVWGALGVFIGIVGIPVKRWFFPIVLLMEVVIGLMFQWFWWDRQGQLTAVARNSSLSYWEWTGLAIAVTGISAVLCMSSFFCVTRLLKPHLPYSLRSK